MSDCAATTDSGGDSSFEAHSMVAQWHRITIAAMAVATHKPLRNQFSTSEDMGAPVSSGVDARAIASYRFGRFRPIL